VHICHLGDYKVLGLKLLVEAKPASRDVVCVIIVSVDFPDEDCASLTHPRHHMGGPVGVPQLVHMLHIKAYGLLAILEGLQVASGHFLLHAAEVNRRKIVILIL
jgi:hypothetical protein